MSKPAGRVARSRRRFGAPAFAFLVAGWSSAACSLLLDLPEAHDDPQGFGGDGGVLSGDGDGDGDAGSTGGASTAAGGFGGARGGAGGEANETGGGGSTDECDTPCDCDEDGETALGDCGGEDCDDFDPRVFPGQMEFFSERADNDAIGFDYDCSKMIERPEEQSDTLNCGALELFECEGGQGYFQSVPCGQAGEWGSCRKEGVSCVKEVIDDAAVALCH